MKDDDCIFCSFSGQRTGVCDECSKRGRHETSERAAPPLRFKTIFIDGELMAFRGEVGENDVVFDYDSELLGHALGVF